MVGTDGIVPTFPIMTILFGFCAVQENNVSYEVEGVSNRSWP